MHEGLTAVFLVKPCCRCYHLSLTPPACQCKFDYDCCIMHEHANKACVFVWFCGFAAHHDWMSRLKCCVGWFFFVLFFFLFSPPSPRSGLLDVCDKFSTTSRHFSATQSLFSTRGCWDLPSQTLTDDSVCFSC